MIEGSKFKLNMRIGIVKEPYNGEQLNLEESFTVDADSFIEIASILGQFQDLAEKIKAVSE